MSTRRKGHIFQKHSSEATQRLVKNGIEQTSSELRLKQNYDLLWMFMSSIQSGTNPGLLKPTQSKSRQSDHFRHEGETVESQYQIRYIYATMEDHGLYFAKYSKGLVLVKKKKIPIGRITHKLYTSQAGFAIGNPGRRQISNNSSLLGVFL
jgi:hypothetical protein